MNPPKPSVGALFDAALLLPREQRIAYVQAACAGDDALRQRVRALLAAHEAAGSFMEDPAAAARPGPPGDPTSDETRPSGTIEMAAPSADEAVGRTIGRYKLRQKIGEGGCGVVYAAEQTEPVRRKVAIKVIKLGMDTQQVIARFEAERQALAMMDHPNIAKVLDGGTTESGRPYFAMELVRGIRITDYCDQNKLGTRDRLALFTQVCQAIQHAHQKGVIHRDIKPSNILVTLHDGVPVPKVIDFGIAKAIEGRLTDSTVFTQLHQFMGTPAYMSPEQAEMSGLDIDTRSDIYSLGVLLYELLSGTTPFDAKELGAAGIDAMRTMIREQEPVRPSTRLGGMLGTSSTTIAQHRSTDAVRLVHQIRGDLDWIVMKCLEKDRTRRYETANGLAADLRRHLTNEPVTARPPSTVYRMQKAIGRNRLAFAAAAVVAASLVAGIGVSTWQAILATRASESARKSGVAEKEQRLAAQAERDNARAAQKRADATLTRMELQKSEALFEAADSSSAIAYLVKAARRDRSNAVAATRLLSSLTQRGLHVRLSETPPSDSVARLNMLSPGGRWMVRTSLDHTAQVWDAWTGQAVMKPLLVDAPFPGVKLSPDGQRLLTVSTNTVRLWDFRMGRALGETLQHESRVFSAEFSPDGQRVLTLSTNTARVWDARTGLPVTDPIPHADTPYLQTGRFSPDGKRVVTAGREFVRVWDAQTGQPLTEPFNVGEGVSSAEFSPDGRRVLTSGSRMVRVWDARTGQSLGQPMKHEGGGVSAHFSPDGMRVVTASRKGTARVWDVQTGQPLTDPLQLHQHDRDVFAWSFENPTQFSPDGQWVFIVDFEGARLWDARTGRPSGDPIGYRLVGLRPQLSSDGQRIVAAVSGGGAVAWDAHPSHALNEPLRHWASIDSVEFSRDGLKVVTATRLLGQRQDFARVWDVQTGLPLTPLLGDSSGSSARFSPDGLRVVTAGGAWLGVPNPVRKSGSARVWDALTGQPLTEPLRHEGEVRSAEFSPDGLRVVTASEDGTARVWDARTGQPLTEPLPHGGEVVSAQFSPEGLRVVTVGVGPDGKGSAQIWDAGTGRPLTQLVHDGFGVYGAQFSPDGLRVVTLGGGSDGKCPARVWDARTGQPSTEPLRHDPVVGVGFARYGPDGVQVVAASNDRSAQVWDALTGQPLTEPLQHRDHVRSAEFSPDGLRVLTMSHNGGAQIWDAQTGQPLSEPIQDGPQMSYARFSPDGQQVVTASYDGTARVWDFPTVPLPVPEWVLQAAEAIADQRFDENGVSRRVPFAELSALKSRIVASSEADVWTRWAKWFFADRASRTIAPFSTITRPEYVRRRIEEATPESLREAVQLSPENGLALARLGQAVLDEIPGEKPRKLGEAGWYSRRALQFSPEEPEAWELKGDLLEREGRPAEALEAYHRREALSRTTNAAPTRTQGRAWSKHAAICRQLELRDEAAACIRRMGIPPRDPKAGAGQVDLSAFYNATLRATWNQYQQSDIDLSGLPTGMPVLADTPFDVRGLIQICDDRYQEGRFPERVTGIPVATKGGRLRFLLGVLWGHTPEKGGNLPEGTSVASFVVHHADGATSERPLVLGRDALEWRREPPPPGEGKPVVAWSGANPDPMSGWRSRTLRLYLVTWNNPRPEEEIVSLDFVSAQQSAAPFLVAVTVE
jgi:WD40 repeat protein/serine/threonine protein kinase